MDREYDIFEKKGGDDLWCCSVVGLEAAIAQLKELAANSPNEFVLMHLPSQSVIAKLKSP